MVLSRNFKRKQIFLNIVMLKPLHVLFMLDNNIYRIYHLTYSTHNENGFPRFMEFVDINKVITYIEKQFIEEYL